MRLLFPVHSNFASVFLIYALVNVVINLSTFMLAHSFCISLYPLSLSLATYIYLSTYQVTYPNTIFFLSIFLSFYPPWISTLLTTH